MKAKPGSEVAEARIDLVPMIDTVMFMLIFFMVTTRIGQKEADLGITLPGRLPPSEPAVMVDEQVIDVDATGSVVLNGRLFEGKQMPELVRQLIRYRLSSEASKNPYMITIQPADGVPYDRVVDVMNACAGAGIKDVTFGSG